MTRNLKLSLIDYIKNERPITDKEFVFVRALTNEKYSDGELYGIIQKYIRLSNIDVDNRKHGPHALRHSIATNLLNENTPLPVITGILGHKNTNTTRRYMTIDISHLRNLALKVDNYEE